MIGIFGRDGPPGGFPLSGWLGCRLRLLLEHAADSGDAEMQPCTNQRFGDLRFAHRRTEDLQPPDAVANEVGELVHGFADLHQGVTPFFVESSHPRCNRRRRDEKRPGRLL